MNWLKNPYPFIFEDKSIQVKLSLLITVFVAAFLYIFRPFNFEDVIVIEAWKAAIIYGLIAGMVCILVTKLMIAFAPDYTAEKNWNIGRQLLFLNIILMCVTLVNLFFAYGFDTHDLRGQTFLQCLRQDVVHTYAIGFFPVLIVTFVGFYIRLKKNLATVEALNKKIDASERTEKVEDIRLVIPSNAKNEDLEINLKDLIFVMADGNYVEFHLRNKDKTSRKIIRNTMSNVAEQLDNFDFLFRSHRAYIVNLNYIQESSGNAQGYQLKMRNTEVVLPVSRTNLAEFKNVIGA
jgi:hypothetical protein